MKEGTIDPNSIKIEGIESEEEKAAKEQKRLEREEALKRKNEELRLQRKQEEKERWWKGADLYRKENVDDSIEVVDSLDDDSDLKKKKLSYHQLDYAKWDSWTPADPVTLAEEENKRAEEEATKNAEFEKNNPDFCNQFVEDMQKRNKAIQKKQESADIARLRGNRFFKAKQFDRALDEYMEALKVLPYEIKTLTNIAQVHIKLKQYDDSLEFLSRTLYLDSKHIKGLSRKAFVLGETGQPKEALECIHRALKVDPSNAELLGQEKEINCVLEEQEEERKVQVLMKRNTQSEMPPSNTHTKMKEFTKIAVEEEDEEDDEGTSAIVPTCPPGTGTDPVPPSVHPRDMWNKMEKQISGMTESLAGSLAEFGDPSLDAAVDTPAEETKIATGAESVSAAGTAVPDGALSLASVQVPSSETSSTKILASNPAVSAADPAMDPLTAACAICDWQTALFKRAIQSLSETKADMSIANTTVPDVIARYCETASALLKQESTFRAKRGLKGIKEADTVSMVAEMMMKDKTLRVYSRTSGHLQACIDLVNTYLKHLASTSVSTDTATAIRMHTDDAIKLLSAVCDGERSSQVVLVESGCLQAIKSLIGRPICTHEFDVTSKVLLSALTLLHVCGSQEVCPKARAFVLKEASLFVRVGNIMGEMLYSNAFSILLTANDIAAIPTIETQVNVIVKCAEICNLLVASDISKCAPEAVSVLIAIGTALYTLLRAYEYHILMKIPDASAGVEGMAKSAAVSVELGSLCCAAIDPLMTTMMSLSQIDSLRVHFTMDLPLPAFLNKTLAQVKSSDKKQASKNAVSAEQKVTCVSAVIKMITLREEHSVNGIAILMNACLEAEGKVRQGLYDEGAVTYALSKLTYLSMEVSKKDGDSISASQTNPSKRTVDPTLRCRAAGLLSRIISVPKAQQEFEAAEKYRLLCRGLSYVTEVCVNSNSSSLSMSGSPKELPTESLKWIEDERGHLIRALAAVAKPTTACKAVALSEDLVSNLLAVFPRPREEFGEVTPTSVTLTPHILPDSLLVGNAARCLLHLADDPKLGAEIFGSDASGARITPAAARRGTEKLICAMATCTDIRVRKNIAILIAKGCRLPGVREKVSRLRGLQMIVELQDRLT